MKTTLLLFVSLITVALLSGCWTLSETDYPEIAITHAASTNTISVVGFTAVLTEYESVHGFRSVYVPGYYGRHYYEGGHYEIVPSIEYVPQLRSTDMFRRRAQDEFEKAGFTIAPGISDRTIEVTFEGPIVTDSDDLWKLAWNVGTIFFCDAGTTRWTARLRIRETRTGKLLFHHDYTQSYETKSIGLLPLFCASSNGKLRAEYMQSWCLSALTDRAIADATAFLATCP